MYHDDLSGTGQNLNETLLTPANVNSNAFGLLYSMPVDGYVFSNPVVLTGVNIPGQGVHNVVYVTTAHDSVYAFDADSSTGANSTPLWQISLINPAAGLTSVPAKAVYSISDPLEIGITGTPVIDPATGTMYLVAKVLDTTKIPNVFHLRLYALDVATGNFKFGSPIEIQGSITGTGNGAIGGKITFSQEYENQRAGLLLYDGTLFIAFAAQNDEGPFHGCIAGYDPQTLQQKYLFYTTPNGSEGGIWMSAAMPTVDTNGNIYCVTGNGSFDANSGGKDFGNSVLKITPQGTNLVVADYFTPFNWATFNPPDLDLGTTGVLLVPDEAGSVAHPHLAVLGSKEGTIYVIDRDNMGHFNSLNNNQVVESFKVSGVWATLAYFNKQIYYCASKLPLSIYSITNGVMSKTAVSHTLHTFLSGASPGISANGTNNAIAWVVERDASGAGTGPAVLWAYNANNLGKQLYTSEDAGARDTMPVAREFQVPIVANGKVYVATTTSLDVFGLFDEQRPQLGISGQQMTLQGASGNSYTIEYAMESGPSAEWFPVADVSLTNSVQTFPIPVPMTDSAGFFRAELDTE